MERLGGVGEGQGRRWAKEGRVERNLIKARGLDQSVEKVMFAGFAGHSNRCRVACGVDLRWRNDLSLEHLPDQSRERTHWEGR